MMKKYMKPTTSLVVLTDEVALMAASEGSKSYTNDKPEPDNAYNTGASRENSSFSIWGTDED